LLALIGKLLALLLSLEVASNRVVKKYIIKTLSIYYIYSASSKLQRVSVSYSVKSKL
jgi:hypothetical protein